MLMVEHALFQGLAQDSDERQQLSWILVTSDGEEIPKRSNMPGQLCEYTNPRNCRNLLEACLRTSPMTLTLSIYCQRSTANYPTSMSGITSSGARIDLQSHHLLSSPMMGKYNWIKG